MIVRLCTYGDPVLRKKAAPIARIDNGVRGLADAMLRTMAERRGVGLAAQQVGRTIRICVIDVPADADVAEPGGPRLNPEVVFPLIMVNPVILGKAGRQRDQEGCLSIPDIWAPVLRAAEVSVSYLDLKGESRRLTVRGLLARAVQHELDHLEGVLFVDRVSPVKKIGLAAPLRRLRRAKEAEQGLRARGS